MMKILVLLVLV